MTEIVAKVISQKGTCHAGHRVGDEFTFGLNNPADLCSWAFHTIFPSAQVLLFGGTFPWEKNPDKTRVACPDPDNPVVFELRRINR
jgi:uncharacterized repeat protein (TIGR04076 family)